MGFWLPFPIPILRSKKIQISSISANILYRIFLNVVFKHTFSIYPEGQLLHVTNSMKLSNKHSYPLCWLMHFA